MVATVQKYPFSDLENPKAATVFGTLTMKPTRLVVYLDILWGFPASPVPQQHW